ncbi:uncharacterized protein LOC143290737 [Babylonia areolata]|uniref:uncharacterized protein LOC143290737 n=1 Tax=Babylonia areolata TaxID=304850 RepID=UPI003FD63FB8
MSDEAVSQSTFSSTKVATTNRMWTTLPPPLSTPPSPVSADTTQGVTGYMDNPNHTATLPPAFFIPCDNPGNIVSPFVAETMDLVVYAGIFPALVTSGVITNVINMAVFARQGLSDRIHLCLFSLAVSDTGFLLFLMCGKSYALISLLDPVAGNYWLQRHNGPVLGSYLAFLAISNTITALIAVERCICILSPLKAAQIFKTKYMRVGIVVVAVYILVLEVVCVGLKYETVEVTIPLTNTSTFVSRLTPFYTRHRTAIDVVYMYMLTITIPVVSLLVVITCTAAITLRLRFAATWRRRTASSMTSSEKQEVGVIRMLVMVCCVYVVCMTPTVAKELALFIRVPGFLITGHLCNTFKVTIALTRLLEGFNSSVNFWIYMRQSSRYRSTLTQLMPCLARKQRKERE